jgi:nucleoporin NUP82
MVIVRGSEVVLAVGKELRMASLADVKARCRSEEDALDEDLELGEYKVRPLFPFLPFLPLTWLIFLTGQTLDTPAINFEIQQLVLNSTSKLLAVVGAHSVVVVVLPRKGWANSVGKVLECRCVPLFLQIWAVLKPSLADLFPSDLSTTPSPALPSSLKRCGTLGVLTPLPSSS